MGSGWRMRSGTLCWVLVRAWSGWSGAGARRSRDGEGCSAVRRTRGFLLWAAATTAACSSWFVQPGSKVRHDKFSLASEEVDFGADFPERERDMLTMKGKRWSVGAQVA